MRGNIFPRGKTPLLFPEGLFLKSVEDTSLSNISPKCVEKLSLNGRGAPKCSPRNTKLEGFPPMGVTHPTNMGTLREFESPKNEFPETPFNKQPKMGKVPNKRPKPCFKSLVHQPRKPTKWNLPFWDPNCPTILPPDLNSKLPPLWRWNEISSSQMCSRN